MSKHVKRLSVFERLGPGTQPEPQHVGTRHRHYPHGDRSVHSITLEERAREKKAGEQEVLGHKQHAPEPELPVDKTPVRRSSRASKLLKERGGGKIEHLYQSHSADRGKMRPSIRGESASSSNSGSMSDGEKEGIEERGRRRNRDSLSGRRSRPSKDVTGVERKERGEHGRTDRGLEEQPADTEAARLDEERRRRRKRERSSLGDADGPRPTSKFPCTEVDVGSGEQRSLLHSADPEVRVRHGKERAERKEHVSSEKKRTHILDSLSDTEPGTPTWGEPAESLLDWSSIAKLPLPLPPPRTVSPMERFDGGAILAEVGSSTLLAGEKLYAEVERAVTGRIQVIQSSLLPETTLQEPFGGEDLACARASYVREQVHQANVLYDLRPCRRALTAQADCNMRKQLRAAASPKVACFSPQPPPASWQQELYASSIALYQSLGKKPGSSGKPSHRLSSSRLGSVLVPR